jgi:hypothetical protein
MTRSKPDEKRGAASVAELLGETLHEMQCRRRHPHPVDHSWGMQGEQLAAALAAHPTPPPPLDAVFAWLIERGQREGQVPTVWWMGNDDWTTDANKAARFESREAAEEVIGRKFTPPPSRGGPSARAVEHGFLHAATPSPDAGELREAQKVAIRRVLAFDNGHFRFDAVYDWPAFFAAIDLAALEGTKPA